MAAANNLELVIEVDAKGANASIKSVNSSLSSMEAAALKTARDELLAKRTHLMRDWAKYLATVPKKGNVVPIRGRHHG